MASESNSPQPRVAFLLPPKKRKKPEVIAFCEALRAAGVENFFLDPAVDYEKQAAFDVIIQKATDLVLDKDKSPEDKALYDRLEQFSKNRSDIPIFDPIECLFTATSRELTTSLLSQWTSGDVVTLPHIKVDQHTQGLHEAVVESGLQYPLICKSVVACGPRESHIMSLVLRETDIGSVKVMKPYIAQPFINHGGRILKVYVLGEHTYIVTKKSLPDIDRNRGPSVFPFDSQSFSETDFSEIVIQNESGESAQPVTVNADDTTISRLTSAIRKATGMSIFGYDCIVDSATGKHYVVDLNYFPSFNGVPQREQRLVEWFYDQWRRHKTNA